MEFDFEKLTSQERYKLLAATVTPRPIAWVTTLSKEGNLNAAPYSFFNVMGHTPPTIAIGILPDAKKGVKDTGDNILKQGEFVVNLVSEKLSPKMNITAIDAPQGMNELEMAQLETRPSQCVKPPHIAESPVSFECRNLTSLVTGPDQVIVIGQILSMRIEDEYVADPERFYVDSPALELVGRLHGSGWYTRTKDTFQLDRPVYADWKSK